MAGYSQSAHNQFLFIRKEEGNLTVFLVIVDDLFMTRNSSRIIQQAKDTLHKNSKMEDLGSLRYFRDCKF